MVTPVTAPRPDDDDAPIDEIDQLLVEYLDGEMDDRQRVMLEQRLLAEPELRTRLGELQSGWEMLDALPPTVVASDFARTTIEMIAASESQVVAAQRRYRPWKRLGWLAVLSLLTFASGWIGYWVPVRLEEQRLQKQLADLPIAEHLSAYLVPLDLAVVEQLSADQVWNEAIGLAMESGSIHPLHAPPLAISDSNTLGVSLQGVDRQGKMTLLTNWERFSAYDSLRQEELRQRAMAIQKSARPQQTLRTLDEFAQWFDQLSPEAQDRILKSPPEEQLQVIQELVQRTARRWLRDYGAAIGETDRALLYERLKALASVRLQKAATALNELPVEVRRTMNSPFLREPLLRQSPDSFLQSLPNAWTWIRWRGANSRNDDGRLPDSDEARIVRDLYALPTEEELMAIEETMSKRSLMILNSQTDSIEGRSAVLVAWCAEIIQQMTPRADRPETMLERYRNTPAEARTVLDLRDPADIQESLRGRRAANTSR